MMAIHVVTGYRHRLSNEHDEVALLHVQDVQLGQRIAQAEASVAAVL